MGSESCLKFLHLRQQWKDAVSGLIQLKDRKAPEQEIHTASEVCGNALTAYLRHHLHCPFCLEHVVNRHYKEQRNIHRLGN